MISNINLLKFSFIFILVGCANTYKLEKKSDFTFSDAYYNSWFSGIKGGGSGYNIFLKLEEGSLVNNNKIKLQNVYFKGEVVELKAQSNGKYKAFIKENKRKGSMDSETQDNEVVDEINKKEIPFKLKSNEAVVSYIVEKKIKYFKIVLTKKSTMDVPM